MEITTADYHTAGEPFRIITAGVDAPRGATVLDRRDWAIQHLDDVRALLVNEPRGHADMYGCFVTPPDDPDAAFGMVFFHKDGFSTACGHGTIAGATWALETGLVPAGESETRFRIDVPSGRLDVTATMEAGRASEIRFVNVPAWVSDMDVSVDIGGRRLNVDVSYGGAFYASCDVTQLGLTVTAEHLDELIRVGRLIKWTLDDHPSVEHPEDSRLSGCYGTIFHERLGPLHQRNVTIFADGEVDRSPCGSGTSARLALLEQRKEIGVGEVLRHESIVGTLFSGRVVERSGQGVSTEIGGRAYRTGHHRFVLEPDDPVGLGFQLR